MSRCMDCKHEECRCCDAPIQKAFDQFAELVKIDPLPPDPDPEKRLVFMKLAELRNILMLAWVDGQQSVEIGESPDGDPILTYDSYFEDWLVSLEGKYAALKV